MHERQRALNKWLNQILEAKPYSLTPLAGDASFRQYSRLSCNGERYVVMDAPVDKEAVLPFLNVTNLLANANVYTPKIYAADNSQGFILMEDLGDLLFLNAIGFENRKSLYELALSTLLRIQSCTIPNHLPIFDKSGLFQEMVLFQEWFLKGFLKLELNAKETQLIEKTCAWLAMQIDKQPKVFVHRDFHSRNLMLLDDASAWKLGVLDFQDALHGPITYDLVSLLKDCYIQLPGPLVTSLCKQYYQSISNKLHWSFAEFMQAFDLCGLQRHLKVLGIFSRLHLRDGKSSYLKDLPLTFQYVIGALTDCPELKLFKEFMDNKVYETFTKASLS